MRVLVAGFRHATNADAPTPARWDDFLAGGDGPGLTRGAAMLEQLAPTATAMAGFVADAAERGWRLLPSVWAGAAASGAIERDAFERVAAMLLDDAARGGFDAVYLDLHGAAVAAHLADADADGELIERLRTLVGPAMPVVASLDLQANVSPRLLRHASAATVCRTCPPTDRWESGARAAGLLSEIAARGPFVTRSRRLPFPVALHAQCTRDDPAAGLLADLQTLETQSGVHLSLALGSPAAGVAHARPLVFGHGRDAEAVDANVLALAENAAGLRDEFTAEPPDAREAVAEALRAARHATKPVVVADVQDDPGTGAAGNATALLHALLEAGAGRRHPGAVALGLLHDPDAAAAAHAAGLGAQLDLALGGERGGRDGRASGPPLRGRFTVRALHDGAFAPAGPPDAGGATRPGASASLEIDGVRVLVTSRRAELVDEAPCRALGVEPRALNVLVVKSAVRFRAALAPIASRIVVARAPGPMPADPAALPCLVQGIAPAP